MNTDKTRIRIYELKLESEKLKSEKNFAAKNQYFEKASNYRDLEKKAIDELFEIESNVIKLIVDFDFNSQSLEYYLELNELLLEFHPLALKRNAPQLMQLHLIEAELKLIWSSRSLLFMRMNEMIQNEYSNLINKRGQLIREKRIEEADILLQKLMGLGEVIKRLNSK